MPKINKTILYKKLMIVSSVFLLLLFLFILIYNNYKYKQTQSNEKYTIYATSEKDGIRLDVINANMTDSNTEIEIRVSGSNYKNFENILKTRLLIKMDQYQIVGYRQIENNNKNFLIYDFDFNKSAKKSAKFDFSIGSYWNMKIPIAYNPPKTYNFNLKSITKTDSFTINSIVITKNTVKFIIAINNTMYDKNKFMCFYGKLYLGNKEYKIYKGGFPTSLDCPSQMDMLFNTNSFSNSMKLDIYQMNNNENLRIVASFKINLNN